MRSATQLGLLREQARRYPVSDDQVVPTRLGNAIRRLEEYGYDRYRLDSQTLWYELFAVASEQARKQVDHARTTIDFLVCMLYGNLLVAILAAALALRGIGTTAQLLVVSVVLGLLANLWYRVAVTATDDWAAAVRALINVGRKPLAEGLGYHLPVSLADERAMWAATARTSARAYDSKSHEQDTHRVASREAPRRSLQLPVRS